MLADWEFWACAHAIEVRYGERASEHARCRLRDLERLGDLIDELATQLQALKRQARQAQRYREISGKIRETEVLQHHLHWVSACAHVEQEEAAFQSALGMVAQETKATSLRHDRVLQD